MAILKPSNTNKQKPRSIKALIATLLISALAFLYITSSFNSTNINNKNNNINGISVIRDKNPERRGGYINNNNNKSEEKYLYWGKGIDCPGKHCRTCQGLGHQESSLRCALEEAIFLKRTFVMPYRMCISPVHNKKGILHQPDKENSEEKWEASLCAMESLYDMELISNTIPVILDNSERYHEVLSTSMKLGNRGIAHVQGISRLDLKEKKQYANKLLLNRTASPLSWFMECKDRNNRTAITLPYSFLPSMAAKKLRQTAEKIKALLGDYDAIHVRRGDKVKLRKDRFGVLRTLQPHLDRDTRPEFILCRISKWVPPGRTLFIASNEWIPGFFSPLSARYKLAYSSNYSSILDPVIENNYQLFMVERLIMMGAKTFIRTWKEDENDLSLTDDPKKNTKVWQIPVYTRDGESC